MQASNPLCLNSAAVYTFHPKIILASTLKMLNIIIKNNHSVDNTQQIAFSISSKIKKEKQVKPFQNAFFFHFFSGFFSPVFLVFSLFSN
jgi:hypothetical protein